ncbi:MAG: hypothetical protein ABI725_07805 [Chloroflexota bacterium]
MEAALIGVIAGGAAAYVGVYFRNPLWAVLTFALGVVVMFGISVGPTSAPSAFLERAGAPGVVGFVVGAVIGAVVAQRMRDQKH